MRAGSKRSDLGFGGGIEGRGERSGQGRWAGRTAGRRAFPLVVAMSGGLLAVGLWGCAKPVASDLDAFPVVEMNKAVPYPTEEERAKRVFEVSVIDRPSENLDERKLGKPRTQVRHGLEKIAASFGAAVIERSKSDDEALRTDRPRPEFEGFDVEIVPSGDFAISTRFTTHRHAAVWSKPSKLPWQSEADVAKKPGTCTHTVEIAFDVELVQKSWEDRVQRTFLVNHKAQQENKDLDQACTISPVSIDTLFDTAISEALSCLEIPLGTRVSPRGHVLAHRKAKDGTSHLYQISLGTEQGVDPEEPIEFRRVDVSQQPDGTELRTERVIATGVATQQITGEDTWVAVHADDLTIPILEGDVVKRAFSKGLLTKLNGPDCKKILAER
ncbi:MAG: hypothetical protein U0900_03905 [Myxococcota bacterium]